ncbi:MAG: carbohydrate-binding family 9-like protein, partial [Lentisphaerae bacterium]|nr:carbohydrate-binding family 9-like protein [Lentisphaerota bacterium]
GESPVYPTRFRIGVSGNNLYVGVLCEDIKGQPFNAPQLEKDDYGIWEGDVVEILLETPANSYYQVAANPAGVTADLDRGAGGLAKATTWDAQAEVAAFVDEAAGTWSVEARIPFTPSAQDPLHEIIGTPPSKDKPWHFNLCRQRARNQRTELEMTAFSPTGKKVFHDVLKFGKLE